jgi:hypothetical protein
MTEQSQLFTFCRGSGDSCNLSKTLGDLTVKSCARPGGRRNQQPSDRASLLSHDRTGLLSYDRAGLPILVHFVAGTGRARSVDRRPPLLLLLVTKNTGVGQVLLLNLTS